MKTKYIINNNKMCLVLGEHERRLDKFLRFRYTKMIRGWKDLSIYIGNYRLTCIYK